MTIFKASPIGVNITVDMHVCRSADMIDNLLLGNYKFRESDFTPNIDHYRDLVETQHPKVLWLGCSDSRVNPERITMALAGEIFVQRNIGNIVPAHDWNFATVLEYAIV